MILNPWDSQGNQIADSNGVYPTIRGCGGAGYQQGYLLQRKVNYDLSESDRPTDGEQSSRELLRTGRL
jgi:hypothetical protein